MCIRDRARPVPEHIKNKGCKKREGIDAEGNEMLEYKINKFEGEIIP